MRNIDDNAPEAWHALHRAFDSTAGQALRSETLPVLFERAPSFERMRADIERFFSESSARFFAGRTPERPLAVHALCRELRKIEKRIER
jgi:mxaA protein